MKTTRTLGMICGLLVAILGTASGQTAEKTNYRISPGSRIWFDATSTLHSFKAVSDSADGSVTVKNFPTKGVSAVDTFRLSAAEIFVPVRTLKSGDDGLDKNMYKSMKTDKFTGIRYKLVSAEVNDRAVSAGDTLDLKTVGDLTIAGITRQIEMNAGLSRTTDGTLVLTGMKSILMSNFGIDPPTMMLGVIKVGDKVVVHFKLVLKQEKSQTLTSR